MAEKDKIIPIRPGADQRPPVAQPIQQVGEVHVDEVGQRREKKKVIPFGQPGI